jgi:hypothetical protein
MDTHSPSLVCFAFCLATTVAVKTAALWNGFFFRLFCARLPREEDLFPFITRAGIGFAALKDQSAYLSRSVRHVARGLPHLIFAHSQPGGEGERTCFSCHVRQRSPLPGVFVEGKLRMKGAGWGGVFALIVLFVSPAWAQFQNGQTLHGLEEVGVVVAGMHPDAERRGLSPAALRVDVEKRLRDVGVRVSPDLAERGTSGKPQLYLTVGIAPLEDFPVYSVSITLQLRQNACLERNLVICAPAITWEDAQGIRTVDVSELASLQQDVRTLVDHFTAAYLAANQRR